MESEWMRFFLAYDPRPALRKISAPVLAISGSKDVQVVPELNEPEIRKALAEGGNPDYEIVRLDGLNHMFQMSGTGSMDEYATIQETFNPGALKVIGDWIVARTTPVGAAPRSDHRPL
jgi:pimeloyl-ACP methyl ester carboxylesterase